MKPRINILLGLVLGFAIGFNAHVNKPFILMNPASGIVEGVFLYKIGAIMLDNVHTIRDCIIWQVNDIWKLEDK